MMTQKHLSMTALGLVTSALVFLCGLSACEKLNPADQVAEQMFKRTQELEGTWNLDKVRYTYKTKQGDDWQTSIDETYADAAGYMRFVYLDSFDFEGDYTFTFDSTTLSRTFTGNYTNAVQEFIRIKSDGENEQFEGQAIMDLFLIELNDNSLKLNRLLAIPEVDEKKWQLEFSKQ